MKMKAWIFDNKFGVFLSRGVALGCMLLVLAACKDAAQIASEKLMDAEHVDDVRELLQQGADVNYMDATGLTPLRSAVKHNAKSVITVLLQNNANVNAKGEHGNTALHDAALYGSRELADMLIGHGADTDMQNAYGNTPLHEAAAYEKHEVVECLLKHNAKDDIKNAQGKTALECAIANHSEQSRLYLLSAPTTRALGSVLNTCGDKALIYRLEKFREGKLRADEYPFLAHLCRFKGKGAQKDTVLCADERAIRYFIGEGADVNATLEADAATWTPLEAAASANKWSIVNILIDHHATCDIEKLDVFLRLMLQKSKNQDSVGDCLDARKRLNGDVDRYATGNSLFLDVLMNNGTASATELMELLLEKGADPNYEDKGIVSNADGVPLPLSLVYAAAHKGNARVVAALKAHGADLDTLHGGMSDLCRAAICNDVQVCRLLLENGADTSVEDSHGETPLFWAIYNNNTDIARLLLKNGADVKTKSTIYKKPLEKLAKSREMRALLQQGKP